MISGSFIAKMRKQISELNARNFAWNCHTVTEKLQRKWIDL